MYLAPNLFNYEHCRVGYCSYLEALLSQALCKICQLSLESSGLGLILVDAFLRPLWSMCPLIWMTSRHACGGNDGSLALCFSVGRSMGVDSRFNSHNSIWMTFGNASS
ncbi:hypothetical protein SDJN03_16358, partial [Cucurbita argyrosperma subsp. sororia]